ncbi:MAG: hypothetical protein IK092_01260, partial [Muribaculaceae bacterium]|nr:hypothetical protein [Muribaculaceae bacterium]
MNDHIDEIDVTSAIATVSDQRREYALRYRKEHDRRLAIAVYQLLCHGLKAEYGIEELPVFEFGHHGKPFFVGHPEIHFNFSHCNSAAVCAI